MALPAEDVWLVRLVLVLRRTEPCSSATLAQSVAEYLPAHSVVRLRRAGPTAVVTVSSPVTGQGAGRLQAEELVRSLADAACQSSGHRIAYCQTHVTRKAQVSPGS